LNFCFVFIFALGNYIFLSPLNENQRVNWSLINLIVFFVVCLIPYQSYKINPIHDSEGGHKTEQYKSNYIYFSTDYEKINPFTRKEAYTKYFQKLIDDKIIDPIEGKKIILDVKNTNEITSYLKTIRHIDYYCASQDLNNLYMKNKNEKKIQYMFGESTEDKAGFSLVGLKNLIMKSSELNEEKMTSKDIDAIRNMREVLDNFSTTNTGICNALIFLDEKSNINDEFENYNFNPWKAEWIYTPEYKRQRKKMIHQIRSSMDYRGEISDDEDSIIKYDDKRDYINERIKQMNDKILKKRASIFNKAHDIDNKVPMFNNAELTGDVDNSKLKQSRSSIAVNNSNRNSKKEKNEIEEPNESNQKLDLKGLIPDNMNTLISHNSYNNYDTSQYKLTTQQSLFPKDTESKPQNFFKK